MNFDEFVSNAIKTEVAK